MENPLTSATGTVSARPRRPADPRRGFRWQRRRRACSRRRDDSARRRNLARGANLVAGRAHRSAEAACRSARIRGGGEDRSARHAARSARRRQARRRDHPGLFRSTAARDTSVQRSGFRTTADAQTLSRLRDHFGYDASSLARTPSPVYRYFEATPWWPTLCLFMLAPLSLAAAAFEIARGNRAALLLSLVCGGLVAGQVLCSHIVSFRYLHPFTVLVVLNAAAVVDGILALAARRRVQIERTMSPRERWRRDGRDGVRARRGVIYAFGVAPSARRRICSA